MIDREIGRGGSCIVYDAMYSNNTGHMKKVRIKECYPFNVDLTRDITGALVPENTQVGLFEYYKSQMYRSFDINNNLFDTVGLTNFISNTLDIYDDVNNTVYIVSMYWEGEPLSEYTPDTLQESISITKSTAAAVQKIHNKGYLYLDIKPENVYIIAGTTDIIQLFDFDSMISIEEKKKLKNDYRVTYSHGYAPLEQKMGKINKIDKCSDVYSIGALLYYLIFDDIPEAPNCSPNITYDYYSSKLFMENNMTVVMKELNDFFHHTLVNFCNDRYQNMEHVVTKLRKIEYLCKV